MPTEKEVIAQAAATLTLIDTATTKASGTVTTIQARIDALLARIIASDSMAEVNALAAQAQTTLGALTGVADALDAIGKTSDDPVPVPVPEPPPV